MLHFHLERVGLYLSLLCTLAEAGCYAVPAKDDCLCQDLPALYLFLSLLFLHDLQPVPLLFQALPDSKHAQMVHAH